MILTKEPRDYPLERWTWKKERAMVLVIWYEYLVFIKLNESMSRNEPTFS